MTSLTISTGAEYSILPKSLAGNFGKFQCHTFFPNLQFHWWIKKRMRDGTMMVQKDKKIGKTILCKWNGNFHIFAFQPVTPKILTKWKKPRVSHSTPQFYIDEFRKVSRQVPTFSEDFLVFLTRKSKKTIKQMKIIVFAYNIFYKYIFFQRSWRLLGVPRSPHKTIYKYICKLNMIK